MLNIGRMFEDTSRIIFDQSPARTFTQSGGESFESTGVVSDPTKEFRVMLAWTDAPGLPLSNAPYVNQLNLEVIIGGVVYQGNNFNGQYSAPGGQRDFLNNVQGVRLPAGVTGPFVIRVHPTVIAGDGVPQNGSDLDQDFALVVTNGSEAAVPVLALREEGGVTQGVTVAHSGGAVDNSLIPGETAAITVALANDSRVKAANISAATLTLSGGASATATYPAIAPNATAANAEPFQLAIPANLRCGSLAEFQLRLMTDVGEVTLPVRVRVGVLSAQRVLLDDDVDGRRVKWKLKDGFALNTATGNSGTSSYRAVDAGDEARLASARPKKPITIPENAGNIRLSFFHIFNFEPGFDGGVLEISTDNGATYQDLGSRILTGGYDGHVTEASENPLGNRFAWTSRGKPGVFSQVVVNLDEFAGKKIRLRFLAGFDGATGQAEGYSGWFIDDIRITADLFACRP